ncbi:uncharacterized protein EV154DRAFT_532387 [Mucor mucedo]|uniref:uncharacterized protein n=1 Tax=Mucor mucedo TaxID=29922 RepID=UPI00221F2E7D|nr:uncharacterized protein EV154DRAFT_532387 [Mucor mucedo]KAI7866912.1 hypothetical protein EV154DRAFT_532387 [Mucor mucedo]
MQQNNMYMWTPTTDSSHVGPMEDDIELFGQLNQGMTYPSPFDYAQPPMPNANEYFQQSSAIYPMVSPMVSPPTVDLTEAVARMNMQDYGHRQRLSLSSNLSLDIQPCISITEPTPIHRLNQVDDFIDRHFTQLSQQQEQQEQQERDNLTQLMDPSFIDDLLLAETGDGSTTDWLSWTPARGNSPVSVGSHSFEDNQSIYSTSPEPNSFFNLLMSQPQEPVLGSSYPSPSYSEFNNNTLSVKKSNNRSRRVSEPPKPSYSIFEEHSVTSNTDRSVRRSHSDKRSRSNSNASPLTSTASHPCLYPGCGKSFTRPYNLTSHMRTHTADRPFACTECGRKFARQHDRNRHEKLHWGVKPYACSHCKKPFARMDALNRHLRVENGCSSNTSQPSF